MSNSQHSTAGVNETQVRGHPRAIIHKRILDEAKDSPDATLNAIATAVPGATTDLVERVLDSYGDPAETLNKNTMIGNTANPQSTTSEESQKRTETNPTHNGPIPNLAELTDKQRQTLREIYEEPNATQGEIAEMLDVTTGTVSKRINKIYGFDWGDREELVTQLFENEPMESNGDRSGTEPARNQELFPELSEQVERLATEVESLHQELIGQTVESPSNSMDVELAAKVIRASMQSEAITTDEEMEVVKAVISTGNISTVG